MLDPRGPSEAQCVWGNHGEAFALCFCAGLANDGLTLCTCTSGRPPAGDAGGALGAGPGPESPFSSQRDCHSCCGGPQGTGSLCDNVGGPGNGKGPTWRTRGATHRPGAHRLGLAGAGTELRRSESDHSVARVQQGSHGRPSILSLRGQSKLHHQPLSGSGCKVGFLCVSQSEGRQVGDCGESRSYYWLPSVDAVMVVLRVSLTRRWGAGQWVKHDSGCV